MLATLNHNSSDPVCSLKIFTWHTFPLVLTTRFELETLARRQVCCQYTPSAYLFLSFNLYLLYNNVYFYADNFIFMLFFYFIVVKFPILTSLATFALIQPKYGPDMLFRFSSSPSCRPVYDREEIPLGEQGSYTTS